MRRGGILQEGCYSRSPSRGVPRGPLSGDPSAASPLPHLLFSVPRDSPSLPQLRPAHPAPHPRAGCAPAGARGTPRGAPRTSRLSRSPRGQPAGRGVLALYVYLFAASQHFAKHTRAQALGVVMGREGPPEKGGTPGEGIPRPGLARSRRARPRFPRRPRRLRGPSAPPAGHRPAATARPPRPPRPPNTNPTPKKNPKKSAHFAFTVVSNEEPSRVYTKITVLREQRNFAPSSVPCPV